MAAAPAKSDALAAIVSGMRYFLDMKIFLFFVLMFLSIFLIGYFGIYVGLSIALQNPFNSAYTTAYPSYVAPVALALVLLSFFLFFYFLSVELEFKKRAEFKVHSSFSSVLSAALIKYPKFLISVVFQSFLLIGGLVLFVVPGVYLGVKSMFFDIESHNGDRPLSNALMDSFSTTKSTFLKPLELFLFYLVLFGVLVYILVNVSSIGLMFLMLGFSIILSFCTTTYTLSSDTLYHLIKKTGKGGITSPLAKRIMGQR